MNTSYQIVEAKSANGEELAIPLPWEFELSEIFVVAEHEASGIAKVYEGAGTLTVDGDGNLVVPALFGGDAFRVWVSRKTQIRHDYDSGGDVIDDKTIDAELKELSRKTVENEKELSRSLRIPEGRANMILPSKELRSGEIIGFGDDGNVAVGKGVPQVRDIYDGFERAKESENHAKTYANASKENAEKSIEYSLIAEQHKKEALKSAEDAALSAEEAGRHSSDANATLGSVSALAGQVSANATAAELARDSAREQANIATGAANSVNETKDKLNNVYTKAETYSKSEIDGVSTGAEVTLKMNEIVAQIKDYEAVTGEKLLWEFWEAVMEEFQRWQMNPNEVKGWKSTNNPFYNVPPAKSVVRFDVLEVSRFALETDVVTFFPFAKNTSYFMASNSVKLNKAQIAPNSTDCSYFCGGNPVYNQPTYFKSCRNFDRGLFNCTGFSSWACLPNCSSAPNAFSYTKMPAVNIAKTLDFLKKWEDGGTHNIGFTNNGAGVRSVATTETITVEVAGQTYSYDNFPRFTMDDENETLRYAVARATAKGWTVQFSAQ